MSWEDEVKEILAKAKADRQREEDLKQVLDQLMPALMNLMILALAGSAIHSPEVRERLRKFLADQGMPPDKIEQALYSMIENSTKPLWEKAK